MPRDIDLAHLRELIERGVLQLIEVLPGSEYAEEHLPGAFNIPLKTLTDKTVRGLDKARPTVVYCWDDL